MKTQAAIDYYGGGSKGCAALAAALDVTIPAIYQWGEYPPDKRQLQLERVTTMKAEPECQARVLGLPLQRATDKKQADRRTSTAKAA